MKRLLIVLYAASLCVLGCARSDHAAIKIGPVEVSAQEFEEGFQNSRYAYMDEDGRAKFLEQYIDTKLILLEAERLGLDKDPAFLKDIQWFWEQALLKRVVSEKNKEFVDQAMVSNREIEAYYEQHKDDDFKGKSFEEIQDQIRWIVLKIKQSQAFSAWTKDLKQRTDIQINKAQLGIKL